MTYDHGHFAFTKIESPFAENKGKYDLPKFYSDPQEGLCFFQLEEDQYQDDEKIKKHKQTLEKIKSKQTK